MEPVRFDALTKSLASSGTRRGLLKGMAAGTLAILFGRASGSAQDEVCPPGWQPCNGLCIDTRSDRQHCGGCNHPCNAGQACIRSQCALVVCDAAPVDCWGEQTDITSNALHCGQCAEACAAGTSCVDCRCAEPDLIDGAGICRSRYARLWVNAFLPGALAGVASMQTVDGERRAVLRLEWPNSTDPTAEGVELFLLADRDPDQRFPGTPFSTDIDAPSVGNVVFDLTLPTMVPTTPVISGGTITVVQDDGAGGYTSICQRAVKPSTAACFSRQPAESGIAYDVNCKWTVQTGGATNAPCPIDQLPIPDIRIQGRLEVERVDEDQLVEVRFLRPGNPATNGRVSKFPAMEMYAALDDGNKVAVFTYEPETEWISKELVPVEDELHQQCEGNVCQGVVARLGCGCGTSCIANQDCFVGDQGIECDWQKSYFVLAGNPNFDPSNDITCTDPRCPADPNCADSCRDGYFPADGRIEVRVDGQLVYLSDPFGKQFVPPIGFEADPNAEIRITGPDTFNTRNGLAQVYLHRIDGPHGLRETQQKPFAGNAIAPTNGNRVETRIGIGLPRSNRGSTICCRDGDEQVCVDRMASKRHCGACDNSCPDGMICLGGNCICPHPGVLIGDQCFDLTQRDDRCGPLQENCLSDGRICAQSTCVDASCRDFANFQVCNGVCVSMSDAAACGPDCEACHIPQQGTAVCRFDGERRYCDIDCPDGFQLCGNECYALTDAQHCGTACVDCGTIPGGDTICQPSGEGPSIYTCGFQCAPGFHNCSGQCVSDDSVDSCGTSCEPCGPGYTSCTSGICCSEYLTICDGSCVDTSSDFNHCGQCGQPCNGECCYGGVCYQAGQSCGTCGNVCSGFQVCDTFSGTCVDPAEPITCSECEELVNGECVIRAGWTMLGGGCIPIVVEE